jgi:hypothetical protein
MTSDIPESSILPAKIGRVGFIGFLGADARGHGATRNIVV